MAGAAFFMTLLALTATAQVGYTTRKNSDGSTNYLDRDLGVSFRVPRQWVPFKAIRWSDAGWELRGTAERATTVSMRDRQSDNIFNLYYRRFKKVRPMAPEEIDLVLLADVDDKILQRRHKDQLKDYRVRSNSYETREIRGQRALSCVADFSQGKRGMVEYLIWVRNEDSIAQFFIRIPADQLDEVRENVEPIIESLRLPKPPP